MWKLVLIGLLVILPISCASDHALEETDRAASALNVPSLTPVPCENGEFTWDGTRVELLFADAIAGCATGDAEAVASFHGFPLADRALRDVVVHMEAILPPILPDDPFAKWRDQRAETTLNCDPDDVTQPAKIVIPEHPIKELVVFTNPNFDRPWTMDMANMDLRWAGLNLCVAMRLREFAPGSSGSEALLLSNAEQRELLETIRERAQIAMLQYALLGSVFASPGEGEEPLYQEQCTCPTQPPDPQLCPWCEFYDELSEKRHYRIPFLQYFAKHVNTSVLRDMGTDFASAVQLHTLVTEEMLELLARSRSARLERGGEAELRADETWGPGSWQQRLLGAAYNGDPLAGDSKSPWSHPSALSGPIGAAPWPSGSSLPYVRQSVDEPQVQTAYALMDKHDVIDLALTGASSCKTVDPEASAPLIYQALETKVREALCVDFNESTQQCTPVTIPADPEQHALYRYYRVREHHVASAVQLISELVGPQLDTGTTLNCSAPRYGSHDPVGDIALSGGNLHVSKGTLFVPHDAHTTASAFSTFASTRYSTAWQIEPLAPSQFQGFSTDGQTIPMPGGGSTFIPGGLAAESQRVMGGIRALVVVRELVASAVERLKTTGIGSPEANRLNDYFAEADGIINVSTGAVGESFSVYPSTVLSGTDPLYSLEAQIAAPGKRNWLAMITAPDDDTFWTQEEESALVLVVVPDDGWSGSLARQPNAHVFGRGGAELLVDAVTDGRWAPLIPSVSGGQQVEGLQRLTIDRGIQLDEDSGYFTFFVWKGTSEEYADTFASVCATPPCSSPSRLYGKTRLLTASVALFPPSATTADYFSSSGALGKWVGTQVQPDSMNPSEPAFDAFGFPYAWVPPSNAQILGGVPGTPAFRHFLDAAEKSSLEAGDAVETAIAGLLDQVADEKASQALDLKLQNETTRTQALMKESAQKLCGFDHATCDVTTQRSQVRAEWYTDIDGGMAPLSNESCIAAVQAPSATNAQDAVSNTSTLLRCIAKGAIAALLSTEFDLAKPVEQELGASSVPSFSDYSGGELQSAFVEQWRAVKAPEERFALMYKQIAAAKAAVQTAAKVVYKAEKVVDHKCGPDDFVRDVLYGTLSYPGLATTGVNLVGSFFGGGASLDAAQQHAEKCNELKLDVDIAIAQQLETSMAALANVTSTVTGLLNDRVAIVQSGVKIAQLSDTSLLEQSRYQLELDLTGSDIQSQQNQLKTSFGLYRRYRGYDAWRAKALLDNARRYALAARRGIEAHYVVDLSRVTQSEAFVASPASWADEIYEYDLSLPAAVGIAVGEANPGGIYSNKVSDFVSNLNGFVDGFAVTRPSAVAEEDVDVVTLKGLAPGAVLTFDDPAGPPIDTYPDFGTWQVKCPYPTGNAWTAVPPVESGGVLFACIDFASCNCAPDDLSCIEQANCSKPAPLAARTVFSLDPWARLDHGVLADPYEARYNARWTKLALNLVGTGIRDCKLAADPLTCYSEAFLRFDLRHIGTGWLTDFAGQWHALAFPSGRIEGGKALAAELWLDPLQNGWGTDYINAVQRTEFFWRPLHGAYVLEIETGPEVRLDRLERVQILVGSSYWVAQQ